MHSRENTVTVPTSNQPDTYPLVTHVIKTILIVDDSKALRRIVSAMIDKWGHTVLEAASAEEAMEISATNYPDLVLSDWMMPGMSGLEFCSAFRALDPSKYSYFILLTSKTLKSEIAEGLQNGADDFLSKPVNAAELRARIAAADRILQMQRELQQKNNLISTALDEIQKLYSAVDRDLKEARKLQQSLLRERSKRFGPFDLSLILETAGHVGGDLVGFFQAGQHHLGIFGVDVSGHGINSALMTARIAGYLFTNDAEQNIALEQDQMGQVRPISPARAVARLNKIILNEMDTELYLTLLLGNIDLRNGRLQFSQAGHPHPIILHANGKIAPQGNGGLPVGLFTDAAYEDCETTLALGDRLFILSDGVFECMSHEKEVLGEQRVHSILKSHKTLQVLPLLDALVTDLHSFSKSEDFDDDVSGILLHYHA